MISVRTQEDIRPAEAEAHGSEAHRSGIQAGVALRAAAGLGLVTLGLRRGGLLGWLGAAAGGALAWRGLQRHGGFRAMLDRLSPGGERRDGVSPTTLREPAAASDAAGAGAGLPEWGRSDLTPRRDAAVDEASRESFPASDPPAFNP